MLDWYRILEILLPAIITAIFGLITAVLAIWQIRAASSVAQQEIIAQQQATELNYRATVLSGNRVRWIEEVRALMAEIIGHSLYQLVLKKNGQPPPPETAPKFFANLAKVGLLLNEDEPLAKALLLEFHNLAQFVNEENSDQAKVGEITGKCARAGRAFLKAEWERVKKGV